MPTNPTVPEKLLRLLTYHENAAANIRATIALMNTMPDNRGRPTGTTNGNGHGHTLPSIARAALQVDAKRRAAKPAKKTTAKPGDHTIKIRQQRQQTANLLAQFDTKEPRPIPQGMRTQAAGVYSRRGYLQRKGKGLFIRTAKPFIVEPSVALSKAHRA
jgi:hypothetical protein